MEPIRFEIQKRNTNIEEIITNNYVDINSYSFLQNIIFDIMPTISAIEASLFPTIVSIQLCDTILNDSYFESIKLFLSLPIWASIKQVMRVSYVFHTLIFEIIWILLPLKNFNLISIIIQIFSTFFIHFILCKIIQIYLEKPLFNYFMKLSEDKFKVRY